MSEQYSYRTRSMERIMRRRRRTKIIAGIVIAIIAVILILVFAIKMFTQKSSDGEKLAGGSNGENAEVDAGYIDDEVYIETMSVGGMDYDTAIENVDGLINSVMSKKVNIDVNGTQVTATLDSLGVNCDKEDMVDKAF